jgi:hypothetical protein
VSGKDQNDDVMHAYVSSQIDVHTTYMHIKNQEIRLDRTLFQEAFHFYLLDEEDKKFIINIIFVLSKLSCVISGMRY